MKISKRVREEAALILAIGASTLRDHHDAWEATGVPYIGRSAAIVLDAIAVARDGRSRLPRNRREWQEVYAEAESLLRCGWSPGDEL